MFLHRLTLSRYNKRIGRSVVCSLTSWVAFYGPPLIWLYGDDVLLGQWGPVSCILGGAEIAGSVSRWPVIVNHINC